MGDAREQLARASFLFTDDSVLFQGPSLKSMNTLTFFFALNIYAVGALLTISLFPDICQERPSRGERGGTFACFSGFATKDLVLVWMECEVGMSAVIFICSEDVA